LLFPEGPLNTLGDRPSLLCPTAPGKGPLSPAADRKLTQPRQPPPQTHTPQSCFGKRVVFISFLFSFFFPLSTLIRSVAGLSLPRASAVVARGLLAALLYPVLVEGPAIRAGCVALLCVERGGPWRPLTVPIILAFMKLKLIAHLLHNKPQLFHGSN
jgi:hypothetical protein